MNKLYIPILIIGTIIMIVVMAKTGASLKTNDTPLGILNLELPFSKIKADSVITAWKNTTNSTGISNIEVAKTNTKWDFVFIVFYSLFLYLSATKLSNSFNGGFGKAGRQLGKASLVVAALDFIENLGMFKMLDGSITNGIAMFTSVCSTIKWLLAIIIVLYILLTAPLVLYNKVR